MHRIRFAGALLPAVLSIIGIAAAQNPPIFPGQVDPVGNNPVAVATGDLDGDGMTDVVTANHDGNSISVLLGNGAGDFAAAQDFDMGGSPKCIVLGDVNGDGRLDVIVGIGGSPLGLDSVAIRLNMAGPGTPFTLGPPMFFYCGIDPNAIALADMNGDGIPDVIVGNGGSADVAILFNDGLGNLGFPMSLPVGAPVVALAVGDFTGDGHADIAAATGLATSPIALWVWSPTGGFQSLPGPVPPNGASPSFLALADVNGDGKSDLLAGCPGGAAGGGGTMVFAFGGNGAGGFDAFTMPTAVEDSLTGMVLYDINSDGKPDLLTSHDSLGIIAVRFGAGAGLFGAPQEYVVGNGLDGATGIAVDKLNTKPGGGTGFFPPTPGHFTLATTHGNVIGPFAFYAILATNDGKFKAPSVITTSNRAYLCPAIGDLDSDGIPDVAALGSNSLFNSFMIDTFKGDGKGGLQTPPLATAILPGLALYFVLGDMNGDGTLDAVVRGGFGVLVSLGTGSGSFGSFTNYPNPVNGSNYSALAVGDIDLDGHLDVVYGGNVNGSNVFYRLGVGNGQLGQEKIALPNVNANGIALGDIDSDGLLDLVASDTPGNVYVALGDKPSGTYAGFKSPTLVFPNVKGPVLFVDINGDSKLDVAACSVATSILHTALGDGMGGFSSFHNYQSGLNSIALLAKDFDRDGFTDVLTANAGSATVSIRFSSATGLASKMNNYSVDTSTVFAAPWVQCAVGDLNKDGAPDVVTAGGKIDVLMNQIPGAPYTPWFGSLGPSKGCKGFQPMSAVGDVKVGNASFQLHCSACPANSLGLGIVATAAIPDGADTFGIGLDLFVDLVNGSPITFDLHSDGNGEGFATVPIPNQPFLVGYTGFVQSLWYWPNACHPSQLDLSSSGAVALYVHQ
jgi:hypothetical protein